MATPMDWALNAVLAHLGLDPEIVKKQIAELAQIVVGTKAQLDRIEVKQNAILSVLEIPQEQFNVGPQFEPAGGEQAGAVNGSAAGHENAGG